MAEIDYIESFELYEIAKKLQERYYLYLGHVDLEAVYFAQKVGKRPKKAKAVELSGISNPWVKKLLSQNQKGNKLYCLSAWDDLWVEMPPAKREWCVFSLLYAIHPENNGKLRKPDVQEFGFILEFFANEGIGPYWQKKDVLPSLLDGLDPLPIPLPPDDTDEGSSVDLEED